MPAIAADSHVTLHYRMALLVDGVERELVDTFRAKPATLQLGAGQWSPGIEECLLGLEEGAAAQFELSPEKAYGAHQRELVRSLSRDQLAASAQPGWAPEVGATVEFRTPEGASYRGVLVECDAERARVDFNHPLAGLPLRVRVQVIGVL
jgi:FKBP-type peptidyl-prolyl cis-trans isomerase SlpA